MSKLTDEQRAQRAEHARRVTEKNRLQGVYRELPRGPYYCIRCDLEMSTAEGLALHNEMRHSEAF